jgi:hypothetical protein
MGMEPESSSGELLRALAAQQGVEPSEADLEGMRGFLETILPALRELEELLPRELPL